MCIFQQRGIQIDNKHINIPNVINQQEMQIKTTTYHFTTTRMAKIGVTGNTKREKMWNWFDSQLFM